MKTPALLLALASLVSTAAAQQPENPDAATPPAAAAAPSQPWLGVAVEEVPAAVRAQLPLPETQGLIISAVPEGSPAAACGLKEHDVLFKFDDQILMSPDQLAKLVRSKKEGDAVKLTILRAGKEQQIEAKLGGRAEIAEQPRAMKIHRAGALNIEDLMKGTGVPMDDLVKDALKASSALHLQLGTPGASASISGSTTQIMMDGKHTIQISGADGKNTISIKDTDGTELYSGPWNTEEDRAKLPEELRNLETVKGLKPGESGVMSFSFGNTEDLADIRREMDEAMKKAASGGGIDDIIKRQEELLREHRERAEKMRQKIEEMRNSTGAGSSGSSQSSSAHAEASASGNGTSASMSVADGEGSVTRNVKDGKTTIIVKDKDGKVTFEGPWNTAEDRAKATEEVRKRISSLIPDTGDAPEAGAKARKGA